MLSNLFTCLNASISTLYFTSSMETDLGSSNVSLVIILRRVKVENAKDGRQPSGIDNNFQGDSRHWRGNKPKVVGKKSKRLHQLFDYNHVLFTMQTRKGE